MLKKHHHSTNFKYFVIIKKGENVKTIFLQFGFDEDKISIAKGMDQFI